MSESRPLRVAEPYTHKLHAHRCHKAGVQGIVLRQFVQARLGKTVYCGRIKEAWDTADGVEMWKLELLVPNRGLASLRANQVRQCSGLDGFCACAGENNGSSEGAQRPADPFLLAGPERSFSQAGVVAPPESLTHETGPDSGSC